MDLIAKQYPIVTPTLFTTFVVGPSLSYHFVIGYSDETTKWDTLLARILAFVVISAIITPVIMEVYDMFATAIRERIHKKAEKRGIERGKQEAHEEWTAWNIRRLAAETKGEPFDEPTPTQIIGELHFPSLSTDNK